MGAAMYPFFHPHFEQFMCIQPDGTDLTTRSMVLPEKPPWPSNPLHRPDPAFLHFYLPAMASLFLCYLASALKKNLSSYPVQSQICVCHPLSVPRTTWKHPGVSCRMRPLPLASFRHQVCEIKPRGMQEETFLWILNNGLFFQTRKHSL